MTTISKTKMAAAFALSALAASAAAPWSDTPVTCHWIGAVKAGSSTYGNYALWTDPDNWAEGIVPGMTIDGANGCPGCTAVFDRECAITAVRVENIAISNIVVSGSTVPQITIGMPWIYDGPYLYLECGGGIYVDSDVVNAPLVRSAIYYLRGSSGPVTDIYFENNSSTPLRLIGRYLGPNVTFSSYAGTCRIVMLGTGEIRAETGPHVINNYSLELLLNMRGGKFVQDCNDDISQITTGATGVRQHLEIPSGRTLTIRGMGAARGTPPLWAQNSDLLVDGGGTCSFNAPAANDVFLCANSTRTLTLDCEVVRTAGGRFVIGTEWYGGGTITLADGASVVEPVDFYNSTLQLADGAVFTNSVSIHDGRSGAISGGSESAAKIAGGVAGTTRPLTLKRRLAIASDITATTTLAADAVLSFSKAGEDATAFTISSLALSGDATIPVEDGVTATIAAINNNGHALDIRSTGTGKVVFSGLSVGRAPEWLTLNGDKARIAPDHTLTPPKGMVISVK